MADIYNIPTWMSLDSQSGNNEAQWVWYDNQLLKSLGSFISAEIPPVDLDPVIDTTE